MLLVPQFTSSQAFVELAHHHIPFPQPGKRKVEGGEEPIHRDAKKARNERCHAI